jgi:small subunit ribosomal protein S14
MAKKSSVEKNNRRKRMAKNAGPRRETLFHRLGLVGDDRLQLLAATLKLAEMPRNSSPTRIRNRCELTGRPRSNYRKNKLSRIALRELGSKGLVPGLVKSSW